jgi:hypothetical protein
MKLREKERERIRGAPESGSCNRYEMAERFRDGWAAFEDLTQAVVEVPRELVPAIRELIAKHKESRRA